MVGKDWRQAFVQVLNIFDINEFYPSIKETLFHEALQFAKMHVNISLNDIKVMFHSRKSL